MAEIPAFWRKACAQATFIEDYDPTTATYKINVACKVAGTDNTIYKDFWLEENELMGGHK